MLRVTEHHHRVVGGPSAPERYRVNDEVEFSATIERVDDGVVAPFTYAHAFVCVLGGGSWGHAFFLGRRGL